MHLLWAKIEFELRTVYAQFYYQKLYRSLIIYMSFWMNDSSKVCPTQNQKVVTGLLHIFFFKFTRKHIKFC